MKNLKIVDVTLRESSANPDFSLSFKEKIEICRQLDKLNTDVIETGELKDEKADALFLHTVSVLLKNSVLSVGTGLTTADTDKAWKAVCVAKKARLHIVVPVSPVKMEYELHLKPDQVLDMIGTLISHAVSLMPDVEFTAGDATRADREFLYKALLRAAESGARIIDISDCAGTMLPSEMGQFIKELKQNVPALSGVRLSVQCGDELGMGAANAFACVSEGVIQLKTAVGIASVPSLEAVAHVLRIRGDSLGVTCRLKTTELSNTLLKLSMITKTKKSLSSPFDSGVEEAGPETGTLDGSAQMTAVSRYIKKLGYDLSKDDLLKVYEAFKRIAEKKSVGKKEIEAIIASSALQVSPTYRLIRYVINSGNVITPTAHITLEKQGKELQGFSVGDGPIDAAFLAIEQITGHHFELDDFQIQSVTEGREAMGDALVKLRSQGRLYSGKGISTDVIGASIHAYISALNKIAFEQT